MGSVNALASPECIYAEDFDSGAAGWAPVDYYAGVNWHHLDERGVMWCGTDDPALLLTPPGYGNNWVQYLTKTVELPEATSATLALLMRWDSEPGYDYTYIQGRAAGGSWMTFAALDGQSAGFEDVSVDITALGSGPVELRVAFISDGGWSDEDGFYDSNGAVELDSATVTAVLADGTTPIVDASDFETGQDGWVATTEGSPNAAFRIEAQPLCLGAPCGWWPYGGSWVAYDDSGTFPIAPPGALLNHVGIVSPPISIPTKTAGSDLHYYLSFDTYTELPLANLVFYETQVEAPAGGPYASVGYLYYGGNPSEYFRRNLFDVTGLVQENAQSMVVRLGATDLSDIGWLPWSGQHSPAPFFDNVRVYTGSEADYLANYPFVPAADGTVVACGKLTMQPNDVPLSVVVRTMTQPDGLQIASEPLCWSYTGSDVIHDKGESCDVQVDGNTLTILDSGGVGTRIDWNVWVEEPCGTYQFACAVEVVRPQ